jgi:hypothetical protein
LRCTLRAARIAKERSIMMTKEKLAELQARGLACIERAKQIAAPAEAAGRKMSDTELVDYNAEVAAAQDWMKQVREAKDDMAVIEKAAEISAAIGGMPGESPLGATPHGKDRRLSFKGMGAAAARTIPDAAPNVKALATGGSVVTGQSFTADPGAAGPAGHRDPRRARGDHSGHRQLRLLEAVGPNVYRWHRQ